MIAAASTIKKATPGIPQDTKDGILQFLDSAQQGLINAIHKLTQLGPPGTSEGKQAQENVVAFLTTAAGKIGDQRAKAAALDANDPHFGENVCQLNLLDLGQPIEPTGVGNDQELMHAFLAAPECQRLDTPRHT